MPNTLVIVYLLVFFSTIDGIPHHPSSSINADAKEVAELVEKVHTFIPKEENSQNIKLCQVVKQCCPIKAYLKILSLPSANLSSDPIGQLGKICLNSAVRGHILKKCPSALKLNFSSSPSTAPNMANIAIDAEFIQLSRKVKEYDPAIKDFLSRPERICNANEHYAYNCMTNKKLLQSCMAKIFQAKLKSGDKKSYETYAKNIKGGLAVMIRFFEKMG